jgi:hypothetical protein
VEDWLKRKTELLVMLAMSAKVDLKGATAAGWQHIGDVGPLKMATGYLLADSAQGTEELRLIHDLARLRVRGAVPVMV